MPLPIEQIGVNFSQFQSIYHAVARNWLFRATAYIEDGSNNKL